MLLKKWKFNKNHFLYDYSDCYVWFGSQSCGNVILFLCISITGFYIRTSASQLIFDIISSPVGELLRLWTEFSFLEMCLQFACLSHLTSRPAGVSSAERGEPRPDRGELRPPRPPGGACCPSPGRWRPARRTPSPTPSTRQKYRASSGNSTVTWYCWYRLTMKLY